ncbi:MAG: LacI family transcriptional regulator [Propionibacteriaceae bacterium]|jgi:DNA-binding LacI/PurR family transcriptional regulator|nr:LacI family transcriptional regulator [Propionibacteriaceae bacterium]
MLQRRRPPTIADVAREAGVSLQTVSRVVNQHPSVAQATRTRVNQVIDHLGYQRNPAARALVTGRSQTIGVMVSSTTLSGPSGVLLAIEPHARAAHYWLSVAGLAHHDAELVGPILQHFRQQGVDGIIVVAQTQAVLDAVMAQGPNLPLVFVSSGQVGGQFSRIDIDQRAGARMVMTMLHGLGHDRIAHIRGPVGDLHADARALGWAESLLGKANQVPHGHPLLALGDWSAMSGYQATLALLSRPERPSAIFAANDRMAIGALRALHDRGLSVPADMSVIGFDDIEGVDCAIPPLTTIPQDQSALGAKAMDLLNAAMAGLAPVDAWLEPNLLVRASVGVAH